MSDEDVGDNSTEFTHIAMNAKCLYSICLMMTIVEVGAVASDGRAARSIVDGPSNSAASGSVYDSRMACITVMRSKILAWFYPYRIGVMILSGKTRTSTRRQSSVIRKG